MVRPGAQAHLGLAWWGPRLDHADTPAVDLLVTVLGGRRSSRLVATVRDRDGLVTSITAGFSALEAAGTVTVVAQLSPGNVEAAEAGILAEVRRIRDEGVTAAELRRAVTVTEARRAFALETAEGRARALGRAETVWRLEDELAYAARVRSVTREQVRAVARRYLDLDRYVRLALVPPR
jgi:zinc protease